MIALLFSSVMPDEASDLGILFKTMHAYGEWRTAKPTALYQYLHQPTALHQDSVSSALARYDSFFCYRRLFTIVHGCFQRRPLIPNMNTKKLSMILCSPRWYDCTFRQPNLAAGDCCGVKIEELLLSCIASRLDQGWWKCSGRGMHWMRDSAGYAKPQVDGTGACFSSSNTFSVTRSACIIATVLGACNVLHTASSFHVLKRLSLVLGVQQS